MLAAIQTASNVLKATTTRISTSTGLTNVPRKAATLLWVSTVL